MIITFQQTSPKGTAALDTSRIVIGADGAARVQDSSHGRLVPMTDEQIAALRKNRLGKAFDDACKAVAKLNTKLKPKPKSKAKAKGKKS